MSALSPAYAVVIDDEPSYLSLLESVLGELLTCPIQTFSSPECALKEIPDMKIGIIVTDFNMPKMDGVKFLKHIEPLMPGVPCLMITGHKDLLDRMDLSDLPMLKAIIPKPFKIDELIDRIAQHWPEAMVR